MQTSLKDSAFNSLQDRICLQNSLGGGGANPFSAIRLLGYPLIINSKVIDISCNRRRNVLINSYIIDKFAVT